MTTLQKKIDFALVLRVRHANPNGDPLNGNRPRTDYAGLGEMTDVCLKRKLRDRLQEHGHAIFVQSDDRKTDGETSLRNRAESDVNGLGKKPFGKGAKKEDTAKAACTKWFDVRAFGQVFAFGKDGDASDQPGDQRSRAEDAEVDATGGHHHRVQRQGMRDDGAQREQCGGGTRHMIVGRCPRNFGGLDRHRQIQGDGREPENKYIHGHGR